MITKGNIVTGALAFLRISGITANASPEDIIDCTQVLDDYMGELSVDLETGYIQPINYGESDPNDDSGLTQQMAGPVKKLLAPEICSLFGKPIPAALAVTADNGMRSLEHLLVDVKPSQNPPTLPIGSGNEWHTQSRKFYPEPTSDDGTEYKYKSEVFTVTIDWNAWLDEQELVSVTYDPTSGITLSEELVEDGLSRVLVSFTNSGYQQFCVKAQREDGSVETEVYKYTVKACDQRALNCY